MRSLVLGASLVLMTSFLSGCGGGGGGGDGDNGGGDGGDGTKTTTTVTPPPPASIEVKVLSYNLEWHANPGSDNLVTTINSQGPFDLLGMQECENIDIFLKKIGKGNYEGYQVQKGEGKYGPSKPNQGDICMAWNTDVFSLIEKGQDAVGQDGWASRMMQWAILNIKGSEKRLIFANTHGPVNQCIGPNEDWKNVAANYIKNTKGLMKDGDHLFFVGDFNCGGTPAAKHDPQGSGMDDIIKQMREDLTDVAQASFFYPALFQPDRIWTVKGSDIETLDWAAVCCRAPGDCEKTTMKKDLPDDPDQPKCIASPSDHMLLKGHFRLPVASGGNDGHSAAGGGGVEKGPEEMV